MNDRKSDIEAVRFIREYTRCENELYRFINTLMPDREGANDVMQETACALWKLYMQSPEPVRAFLPWACKVAHFEVLRYRRGERIRRKYFSDAVVEAVSEQRMVDQSLLEQRRKALDDCLTKLAPEDRELIQRRYTDRQSVADLAEQMGKTAAAAYKRLERIRAKLFECVNRAISANLMSLENGIDR